MTAAFAQLRAIPILNLRVWLALAILLIVTRVVVLKRRRSNAAWPSRDVVTAIVLEVASVYTALTLFGAIFGFVRLEESGDTHFIVLIAAAWFFFDGVKKLSGIIVPEPAPPGPPPPPPPGPRSDRE
jgi:hypothetical protein